MEEGQMPGSQATIRQDPPAAGTEELLRLTRNQLRFTQLAAIFAGLLFLAVTATLLILVPQVVRTLGEVNQLLAGVNGTLEDIEVMTASLTRTSDGLDRLLTDNADKLTDSVKRLSEIDFEAIDEAVRELREAVGPLSDAMGKLGALGNALAVLK